MGGYIFSLLKPATMLGACKLGVCGSNPKPLQVGGFIKFEMKLNAKGILTNIIAQKMKDEIRENFKFVEIDNEIKEIYAENSFHLTDNEEEYNYQKEIINKYVYKNKC